MDWIAGMVDRLAAAAVVAVFAVAASQAEPLATQYSARTARQLDEAERHFKDVQSGVRYQTVAEPVRAELEAKARSELDAARATHGQVAGVFPLLRPVMLWQARDGDAFVATAGEFVPRIPRAPWAIAFTVLGAIVGFAFYELVKWPVAALLRAPPRRRFKKRANII